MDMLCFECHFYSLILMAFDAKRVTCSENYSSKFNCPMIEIFATVTPVFYKAAVIELLWSKTPTISEANLVPLNLEQKVLVF